MGDTQKKESSETEPSGEGPENDISSLVEDLGKKIVGPVEKVLIGGKEFEAKIDTGADRCSICESLVEELNLGPPIEKINVISSHGRGERDLIEIPFEILGEKFVGQFSVIDRNHLSCPILIGKNILKKDFLVDVTK